MGNRTPRPCGLRFRITEPSARCTKKARRPSVGEGWSFCRACWLQQQGTQTEQQARLAGIKQRQRKAKKLQEVHVDPTKKIVQKSKESVESDESDDEEKEEEVTQSLNNS